MASSSANTSAAELLQVAGANRQKLEQLYFESSTWKRQLAFMMDENVCLKNRVAEVLKGNFDKGMLDEMDYFQGMFVKEDESVRLLRNDIATLDKLLVKELFTDNILFTKAQKKLKEIRNNVLLSEAKFGKLKADFNVFLAANL